jgi:hypothetical protein
LGGATLAQSGNQYEAVFTNIAGTATSTAATLTVNPAQAGPVITLNPTSQTLSVGQDASFTAAATGIPAPTVQWFVEAAGSTTFAAIAGKTSPTLDIGGATLAENGNKYEAVFTNSAGTATTAPATLLVITTNAPPEVTAVSVDSTAWSPGFPYASGYPIPTGASQLTDLPWINLNQVNITFNQPVNIAQGDLTLNGVKVPNYTVSNFSYNATTFTATWTLGSFIGADKLALDLSGTGTNAVTAASNGEALDGTWTNGGSTFPSGHNAPGTDFNFDLNVLPGDVIQTGGPVTILDLISVRDAQSTSPASSVYSAFYDVDGSGNINILDVVDVRNLQLTSLPTGTPILSTSISTASASPSSTPANSVRQVAKAAKAKRRIPLWIKPNTNDVKLT